MEINKYSKYEKNINKSTPFFKGIGEIYRALKGHKFAFFLGLFLIIASSVPVILIPFFIKDVTNNIDNVEIVVFNIFILLGLYLSHSVLQYVGSLVLVSVSEKLTYKLREDIHQQVLNISLLDLTKHEIGEILSLITNDIDTINFSLTNNVITMFSNVLSMVGSLISAIIISPILSIFLLLPFILSLIRTLYISKIMRKKYYQKSIHQGSYEGELNEWINAKTVIEAYGLNDEFVSNLLKENDNYHDTVLNAEKSAASLSPFSHLIQHSCLVIISIVSLLFIENNLVTVAIYSSFIIYSQKFAEPVGDISVAFSELSNSFASFIHIKDFLNEVSSRKEEGSKEIDGIKEIKGSNISFSYDKTNNVLESINFSSINKGTLALIGHTGCGKTTLISLILTLLDDYKGNLEANNVDYKDLNKVKLKDYFSYVSQEPWIFKGTVLENLTYGLKEYDMNNVKEVCDEIGLGPTIEHLPHQYDEVISRNIKNLSTGQLQMISVARAIIQNKEFLIMDEPTSNMDFYSEIKIKNALDKFRKNKSTIVIAHRLSTIQSSKSILLLDKGKVVEQGTHEELIKKKGMYYELFSSNFVTEE